jgi:hypothetical protein
MTYHQVVKIVNTIEEEVESYFNDENLLKLKNGRVNISEKFPSVDIYRQILCDSSMVYKLILRAFNETQAGLDDFAEETGYSKSTILRKTKQMRKFLEENNLEIQWNPIKITGKEAQINHFYSNLFWLIHHGIPPFEAEMTRVAVEKELMKPHYELLFPNSSLNAKRLETFVFVTGVRKKKGKFPHPSDAWENFYESFEKKLFSKVDEYTKKQLNEVPRADLAYWLFTSFLFESNEFLHEGAFYEVEKELLLEDTPLIQVQVAKKFFAYLQERKLFSIFSKESAAFLFHRIVSTFIGASYIKGRAIRLSDFVGAENENKHFTGLVEGLLRSYYIDHLLPIKELSTFISEELFVQYISKLIYLFYVREKKINIVLKVGVYGETEQISFINLFNIFNRIEILQFEDLKVDEAETYDFIISTDSKILLDYPDIHSMHWELGYKKDEMLLLFERLISLYGEKSMDYE